MMKFFVELVGTFIFLSVILKTGSALPIAVALASVIYFGGDVSGGHFNPAVSFMTYLNDSLFSVGDLTSYVVAQLLGASAALMYFKSK
jgi:aquaporin Z